MKNQNSKKMSPFTFLAIAIGIILAITDDYIIEYLGNRPVLGILLVGVVLIGLFTMVSMGKVEGNNS